MATRLLYLEDFDVIDCEATVVAITDTDDNQLDIQLDQTCFYPRGGGQDWDEGTISGQADSAFIVTKVQLDEFGVVHHIGTYQQGKLTVGDTVVCTVDAVRRGINTRLHSAGHAIDLGIDQLGLGWEPVKAGHYPHMSFVEYDVSLNAEEAEHVRQTIEKTVQDIVTAGSHNEIRFMPVGQMRTVCRHVPANIPTNKPARVVMYSNTFGIPCGGTHVRDLHDIGTVIITKLQSKKGLTKVSYRVEGIN